MGLEQVGNRLRKREGRCIAALALAGILAFGLMPAFMGAYAQPAYADEAELSADPIPITGGTTISDNGTYQITAGSTGIITIADSVNPTLIGQGAAETFSGLSIVVGDDSALTIRDFWAELEAGNTHAVIDFEQDGTLNIEGTNVIDNLGSSEATKVYSVIHVPYEGEVHFTGSGTLYGYKSALCSYIGGNADEANGTIVFDSGTWFLKGTKTGAVIGGDSTSVKGKDIVINGGELYVKGVAKGALIGGSNQGISGDVYVNGGLIELFEDFSGPAIGAGEDAHAGKLYVTGGSLKTVLSSNSYNSYGGAATFNGMPSAKWDAVKATNASDYALLTFDASDYISDLSTDTVTVKVDGNDFYSGRAYTYVTNEVKNPTAQNTEGAVADTAANWLANDAAWLVTKDNYGTSAYPNKSGSSFVVDRNLYFALSKEDHTVTIGEDTYMCIWNSETETFDLSKDIAQATVSDIDDQVFTGQAAEPAISVSLNGAALVEGTDFAVRYENNVDVGTATAVLTGIEDYTGTKTVYFSIVLPEEEEAATEVAGTNRYATMQAIAEKAYPNGADGVIIATGENFPDALAASSLAGARDWPIILTEGDTLSSEAKATIEKLQAEDAIIVGGKNAVSNDIYSQVNSLLKSGKVERISGDNRYETADAIYEKGADAWSDTAIIATGEKFADALAISGYAFKNKAPIFLVDEDGVLTEAAQKALKEDGYTSVYILGGDAAVPFSVDAWVAENVKVEPVRLKGDNRYETSKAIADFCIQNGCTANGACIATGDTFPDALAGGVLAGKFNSVLLLADEGSCQSFDVLKACKDDIEQIYFLGGESAVPSAVRTAAKLAAELE